MHILTGGMFDEVWHKQTPLKVSLFSWRLICNRLPTRDNFVRRQILQNDDNVCLGGCGSWRLQTTFGSVWHAILQWLGISFIAPGAGRDHFLQFGHHAGLLRSSHPFLNIIWLACVWLIWKEQNNRVFHQKALDSQSIANKIKMLSFIWLKSNLITFVFSHNDLLIFVFLFISVTCIMAPESWHCNWFRWFSFARLVRDESLLLLYFIFACSKRNAQWSYMTPQRNLEPLF